MRVTTTIITTVKTSKEKNNIKFVNRKKNEQQIFS